MQSARVSWSCKEIVTCLSHWQIAAADGQQIVECRVSQRAGRYSCRADLSACLTSNQNALRHLRQDFHPCYNSLPHNDLLDSYELLEEHRRI
jgi:hypothetical protein